MLTTLLDTPREGPVRPEIRDRLAMLARDDPGLPRDRPAACGARRASGAAVPAADAAQGRARDPAPDPGLPGRLPRARAGRRA
jgi:hypothetical protein